MFQQQYDAVYTEVHTQITGCNYGAYQATVTQQVYMFLKQYTNFKVSQSQMSYSDGSKATWLFLSGSVPLTYNSKQYTIPLNIILPIGFPGIGPKVYLAYKLDAASAKQNPLIINESEVMNNYIHKWQGNNPQYTLGGLCYNLAKSFEMHPPLGESPKTESTGIMSSVASVTTGLLSGIKTGVAKVTGGSTLKEEPKDESHTSTGSVAMTPEMKKREAKIEKVRQKIEAKYIILNEFFEEGKSDVDPYNNHLTWAKSELDDNSMALKRQILILENEMQEMKDKGTEMSKFITKHKGKEVNKVSYQYLIFRITLTSLCCQKTKIINQCWVGIVLETRCVTA